jgi:repressor LexA
MVKTAENDQKNVNAGFSCRSLPEFGELLRSLRHTRSMTLDQLAQATGISKPYLSNIETARLAGPPSPEILTRLEDALGVTDGTLLGLADWLRTPDSIRRLMSAPPTDTSPRHSSGVVNLDLLLNAGKSSADQNLFAQRIEGDSMAPEYRAGDIVVLSAAQTPHSGSDCLVRLDEPENFSTTFRRIYFVDPAGKPADEGSLVQLVPLNSAHTTRTVRRTQITGLFPAVWKITPAGGGESAPVTTKAKTKKRKTSPAPIAKAASTASSVSRSSTFSIEND